MSSMKAWLASLRIKDLAASADAVWWLKLLEEMYSKHEMRWAN
jgi:hypothetical protein